MTDLFVRMIDFNQAIDDIKQEAEDTLAKQKIAVMFRDASDKIWDDAGSGADRDVSIWTLNPDLEFGYDRDGNPLKGFKLLGDRACNSHGSCGKLMLVKDISEPVPNQQPILKRPDRANLQMKEVYGEPGDLFHDGGPWPPVQVRFWKLIADPDPNNGWRYRCIGDVVTSAVMDDTYPDLEKYRCIREDYDRELWLSKSEYKILYFTDGILGK